MSNQGIEDVFAAWGFAPGWQLVRQSANEVYRCRRGHRDIYARVTFSDHRELAEIEAEVAWMQSLYAQGVHVVELLPALDGAYVTSGRYKNQAAYCIASAAAPGRIGRKPEDLTEPVVAAWARLVADLHAHARSYKPAGALRRRGWDHDRVLAVAEEDAATETHVAQQRLRELVQWIKHLPRTPDRYGITHADLHLGNLSVQITDNEPTPLLTAFDFDDACEQFFVHDLAVAVTSMRKAAWECAGALDADRLVGRFLEAYAQQGVLDAQSAAQIEPFVSYRIALSTCWASHSQDTGNLDADMASWFRRSLPWWLQELERHR